MQDLSVTIQAQYAQSATLLSWLSYLNSELDQASCFDAFYSQIWDVYTAQGYGLDVWGRIVGVPRSLPVAPAGSGDYFGFEGTDCQPFKQAPFYTSGDSSGSSGQAYQLSDDMYRALILAKAAANLANASYPALNSLLKTVFGSSGRCYAIPADTPMTIRYVFEFPLTDLQRAILLNSGVIPNPCGVEVFLVYPS
jgi:hypothetical protein